jgi:hypothetical protein
MGWEIAITPRIKSGKVAIASLITLNLDRLELDGAL